MNGSIDYDAEMDAQPHESGYEVNDATMKTIRKKYECMDRIIKAPAYDGKAIQHEAWQAFRELQFLRRKVANTLALATSAELVEELHSRIAAEPPTTGTING